MTGANRNAFLVQDRADVVRVNVVDHERQHTRLVLCSADDSHAFDCRNFLRCVAQQLRFVCRRSFTTGQLTIVPSRVITETSGPSRREQLALASGALAIFFSLGALAALRYGVYEPDALARVYSAARTVYGYRPTLANVGFIWPPLPTLVEIPFVLYKPLVTTGLAIVAGEITSRGYVEIPNLVRKVIGEIGYDSAEYGFDSHTCGVVTTIDDQSPDIAMGVDTGGAGDQGLMFGFACRETRQLMPLPIMLAHALTRRLATVRRQGVIPYLRPDGKSQVTVEYDGHRPVRVDTVVVSTQHADGIKHATIERDIIRLLDVVVVRKDEGGQVNSTEVTDLAPDEVGDFVRLTALAPLLSTDDLIAMSHAVVPGSTAA